MFTPFPLSPIHKFVDQATSYKRDQLTHLTYAFRSFYVLAVFAYF